MAGAGGHGTVMVVGEGAEDGLDHGLGGLDVVGGERESGSNEMNWAGARARVGVEEGSYACLRVLSGFAYVRDGSGGERVEGRGRVF